MSHYLADERDVNFVLFEHLKVHEITQYEKFNEFAEEDFRMIISEALKFAQEVVSPLNKIADEPGCRYEDGNVYVPEEFHKAYDLYRELGWGNLPVDPEYGGQGLPHCISFAAGEYLTGASCAFAGFPLLGIGAANLIYSFGTQEMKDKYCHKMYSGQWGGTMCLTEPQAGSAVGDIRTKAVPNGDHYLITGNKIFISVGQHDLVDNIVHLLLGKVEGAPSGIKGVSLFVVPKILVNDDGSLGEPNDVLCTNIEHKMGLHGSPTCSLSFGENNKCKGYLIGKENEGIKMMFQLMNEARIGVGLQGVAVGNTAYLNALNYAKERIQGTAIEDFRDADAPRVPIIDHPDIRRMLMTMKCYAQGTRALVYLCGYLYDLVHVMPDGPEKEKTNYLLEILTPICKAYSTDMGLKTTDMAFRIYGGYGYMHEYPIEQYIRDLLVSIIYEGTNSIQALDLLGRKVSMKQGAALIALMGMYDEFIAKNKDSEELGSLVGLFEKAKSNLLEATMALGGLNAKGDMRHAVFYATPYAEAFGDVVIAYLLLEQAVIANEKLQDVPEGGSDHAFFSGKIKAAQFFINNILPKIYAVTETIKIEDRSAIEIPVESF